MGIKKISKYLGQTISKNGPTILTGAAVAGVLTTAILAVKATPKALEMIEDELWKTEGSDLYREDGFAISDMIAMFGAKNCIRVTWRLYLPAVGVGAATILCLIGANSINLRRNAALASVYTLTETAFKEYQTKVTDTIGKNKEQKIRDEVVADHVKKNPPHANEIIHTGFGTTLCLDAYTGRYFEHDIEKIRAARNRFNERLLHEDHLTLNEFYWEIGLEPNKFGEMFGWHIETGSMELKFTSTLTENEIPCLVIDYAVKPLFMS